MSRSERRFSIGLTGGIGSGKTAVSELFAGLGAAVVDTDAIAHSLTRPGGAAMEALERTFGALYITIDGGLDRQRMRELVFRDPSAKSCLEAILHPLVREEAIAEAQWAATSSPYVIFVVPLLIESGHWRERIDRLLVIDCAQSTQEARVSARSRLDVALVRRIIAQQATRASRLDVADDILVNDGPRDQLEPRIRRLHQCYCDCADAKP